ncbi:MAG: hypothetical protein HEQ25_22525 [Dolichospermum sp. DET73]|nr:hypothetical protein [Dolichospermum sp. DET73]
MNKIFDDFRRSQESGVRSQEEERKKEESLFPIPLLERFYILNLDIRSFSILNSKF